MSANADNLLRVPPQNLEAEQSVLGAILLDNDAINQAREFLSPDDFYRDSHRLIFRAMVELKDRKQPIDAITLTDALTARGALERIGGPAYIAELASIVPTAANVVHYARIVHDKARLRVAGQIGQELAIAACENADPDEITTEAQRSLERIRFPRAGQPVLGLRGDQISPTETDWFWEGYIARGCLTLFDGDPGEGKSTLTIDLAAHVSRGRDFPDASPCPQGIAIIASAEDSPSATIIPRLIAARADLANVHIVPIARDTADGPQLLTLPEDLEILENTVVRTRAILVIIDPLSAFTSNKINSRIDTDVRRLLAGLTGVAERTGAVVVVVRHLNKTAGTNAIYRGGGSIGIIAAARAAFLIGADPDDEAKKIFAPVKMNLAPKPPALAFRLVQTEGDSVAHVEWIAGETPLSASDLLRAPLEEPGTNKFQMAVEVLMEQLGAGPAPVRGVETAAKVRGVSERTLNAARKVLKIEAFKDGLGPWLLKLPNSDGSKNSNGAGDSSASPAPLPQSESTDDSDDDAAFEVLIKAGWIRPADNYDDDEFDRAARVAEAVNATLEEGL
jgi:archaellum biogenesis ATPase FlaH